MNYFDSYFDASYFEEEAVTSGGPSRWTGWNTRNVQMPPVPSFLALAEKKRRRIEEETIAAILRDQKEARRHRMQVALALGVLS